MRRLISKSQEQVAPRGRMTEHEPRRERHADDESPEALAVGAMEHQSNSRPPSKRPIVRIGLAVLGAFGGWLLVDSFLGGNESVSPPTTEQAEESDQAEDVLYRDPQGRYSITHPADWEEKFNLNGIPVTFVSPVEVGDDFGENLGIVTDQLRSGMTFERYERLNSEFLERTFDAEILSSEKARIAGLPAFEDHATIAVPGHPPIESYQWIVNADGDIYILTLSAESASAAADWLPVAREMVASFDVAA
jgi:hypothetical protein